MSSWNPLRATSSLRSHREKLTPRWISRIPSLPGIGQTPRHMDAVGAVEEMMKPKIPDPLILKAVFLILEWPNKEMYTSAPGMP